MKELQPGAPISHYQILDEVGRGGMGVVYRAEDTKLRRTVALKLLSTHMLGNEADRARFYREARAAAGLQHPNIATVYEIDEDGDHVFIALEFIDGKSIETMVEEGPLPLEEVIDITIQIAGGLHLAHERNIVHRDMKSGNVMVTKRGVVKVLDFGLAKTAASTKLTQYGSTIGTVAYMSPEQARGTEVDSRTDIWSLGAVLYEMIAGVAPFPGDYEQAVVYGILNNEPKALTSIRTGVPMELERIVGKCLRKDVALRYQHADDLAADLKAVDLERAAQTAQNKPTEAAEAAERDETVREFSRARPAWVILALILGLLAGWLLWHSDEQAPPRVNSMFRVTSEAELELQPALSPDGTMIAYVGGTRSQTRLFVRQVAGGSRIDVAPDLSASANHPSWSGDGSRIAFMAGGQVFIVPALGGTPDPLTGPPTDDAEWHLSPSWEPNGDNLVLALGDSMFAVDTRQKTRELLAAFLEPHTMAWSPDGTRIAGTSLNSAWNIIDDSFANIANSRIWVLDLESGKLNFVSDSVQLNVSPAWTNEGAGLLYVSGRGGGNDIYHVRLNSDGSAKGDPQRVTVGLDAHTISSDRSGSTIAVSRLTLRRNVWRVQLSRSGAVSVRDADQITFGSNIIEALDVSGDGTRLAFDSGVAGNQDIYLLNIGEREQVQLTTDPGNDFMSSWWPDQKHLSLYSMRNGKRELFTLDTDTRRIDRLPISTTHESQHPHVSPDGRRIVYRGFGLDSQPGMWITEESDQGWSDPVRQPGILLGYARWSPDGSWIAYEDDRGTLNIFDPATQESRTLLDREDLAPLHVRWSADGQTLYFYANDVDGNWSLYSIPFEGGEPRLLVAFDDPGRTFAFHYFAIHDDYAYFTLEEADSDIWVLELE